MSASHTGPDAMVTVKVTYDGTTRRVKMPLREMIPRVLEEHIRTFLHIPVDRKAMVERYSDSAASFVLLDSTNLSVYKQLYRAAKAKSKLKLRVTLVEDPAQAPKAASNDQITEPVQATEPETKPETETETKPEPQPVIAQPASQSQTSLPPLSFGPSLSKQYDPALLAKAANMVAHREELRKDFESRLSCLLSRQSLNSSSQDTSSAPPSEPTTPAFAVCCNHCSKTIHDAHYHCSTCDDGDFDVCQACIERGLTCQSDNHWLIKRSIVNGIIVRSSTEKLSPKPKPKTAKEQPKVQPASYSCLGNKTPVYEGLQPVAAANFADPHRPPCLVASPHTNNLPGCGASEQVSTVNLRTCNACLVELPEVKFLHCLQCEDFDLCQRCFLSDRHGHHPMHAFASAVPGTKLPDHITIRMAPGRNRLHLAICDGCDLNIYGVRHKCLDCPDWDYCGDCVEHASFVHANHRFVALYEPLEQPHCSDVEAEVYHDGICCDGPLCSNSPVLPNYIRGTRYKCAICPDLDFCANCEASPANDHNKTHPLIKFKTQIRHVRVTTTGEHQDGRQLHPMGDRFEARFQPSPSTNSVNPVQTVVDVKPEEPEEPEEPELKKEEPLVQLDDVPQVKEEVGETIQEEQLKACFVRESVSDGTIYGLNHVFEQTWTLRNDGNVPWPAGCVVKFSGGDYMGHVDSTHPTGISDLVSASQSTICYSQLPPGQEFQFTVLLRTPTRAGKFISYWRLCTEDGYRFGERLWCEVQARSVKAAPAAPAAPFLEQVEQEGGQEPEEDNQVQEADKAEQSQASSTMVFPKLETESPNASVHEETKSKHLPIASPARKSYLEWDGSDDGFMTDEEYDILDASDEEYLEEQHRKMKE